jgi:hypothetical protein
MNQAAMTCHRSLFGGAMLAILPMIGRRSDEFVEVAILMRFSSRGNHSARSTRLASLSDRDG